MNAHPLVSVIIPAYNAAQFLAETIQSVLAQSYRNWELLIINDGSTDNTTEVAEHYCQYDPRIQLYSQPNQGVSTARNLGIELAQGALIAFLDADDRWFPHKLTAHIEHLTATPPVGVSFAKASFIKHSGDPTGTISSGCLSHLKPEDFLYENPTITTSNLVVRRELFDQIGCFDPAMSYSEDLDWLFRVMCSKRWMVQGIDQVLIEYRTTGKGLSSSLYRIEEGWRYLIDKAQKIAPEIVEQHYSIAQAVHLRYLARQSIRLGLPSEIGVDFMTRALKSDWRILFKNPRRSLLTFLAVYGRHLTTGFSSQPTYNA